MWAGIVNSSGEDCCWSENFALQHHNIHTGYSFNCTKSLIIYLSFLVKRLWKGLVLRIWNSFNFSSADFSFFPECIEPSSVALDFVVNEFLIGFVCVMNHTCFNNLWFQLFFNTSSICSALKYLTLNCQAPTQLSTPSPLQPNSISTPSQFNSSKSWVGDIPYIWFSPPPPPTHHITFLNYKTK